MAWFFLDTPTPVSGRLVERGLLLYGGLSDASVVLDDVWLFDLTNQFGDAGPCPWVKVGTAAALHSAGLVWNHDDQEFVLLGGFEDFGSTIAATNTIRSFTVPDAVAGNAFTTVSTLPDVTYSTAIQGDRTETLGQIAPDTCIGSGLPEVPCVMNDGAVFDIWASGLCDSSGYFKSSTVQVWGAWDPCAGEVTCNLGGYDYSPELDLWPGCQDDPQCDGDAASGLIQDTYDQATLGHLAEVGAVWDPATGDVVAFGGTTGCSGSCTSFPTSVFDLDGTGTHNLAAANADAVVRWNGSTAAATVLSGTAPPSTDWPTESTYGRRAAALSASGLGWDYNSMSPTSTDFTPVLVGGTQEQGVAPGVELVLDCADWLCTNLCIEWESTIPPLTKPFSSDIGGIVASADMVGAIGATGAYTAKVSTTRRMHAAAANMDDEVVLVIGGLKTDGSASDELNIVDIAAGTNTAVTGTALGSRVGASAVHDALGKAVWVFGGQAGDTNLYRVGDDLSVPPEDAAWLVGSYDGTHLVEGEIEVFLSHDGSSWRSGTRFDLALDCADCWAEDLYVRLGSELAADIRSVTASVAYSDAPEQAYELEPLVVVVEDGGAALFRLPRVAGPGHILAVEIVLPASVQTAADFGDPVTLEDLFSANVGSRSGLLRATVGDGADETSIWALKGLPALPLNASNDLYTVTSTIEGPSGSTSVAPGARGTDSVTFGAYGEVTRWSYAAFVFESLEYQAFSAPIGGGANLHYWTDQLIEDDAGQLNHYISGSHPKSASDDLDFLTSRLGAHPQSDLHLLFLRHGETSVAHGIAGVTGNGVAAAFVADRDGTLTETNFITPFHEAAHFWLGSPTYSGHAQVASEARTLVEGVPRLLEFMRDPNEVRVLRVAQGGACTTDADCATGWGCDPDGVCARYVSDSGDGVLRAIATGLNERDCLTTGTRLEADDEEFLRYWANAYVWLQLIEVYRADGSLEGDFWAALRSELSADPTLTEGSVRMLLDTRLGMAGAYDEWFDDLGKSGSPLVGISDFNIVADTGGNTDRSVTIAQVQDQMYTPGTGCDQGAETFSRAPFTLGCDALADAAIQTEDTGPTREEYVAFDECTFMAEVGAGGAIPYAMTGNSMTIDLTPNANLTVDPMPARFAMGASDTLLPGWEDTFAADASDWHRRCDSVTGTPGDCYDGDGDGYPNLGDCDSSDVSVHPDQAPISDGTGTDYNCDGWVWDPTP